MAKIPQKVIRSRKQKDRQYHGQQKRDKKTNNDLENNTQKTTEWATRTPLKLGVNECDPERYAVLVPMMPPIELFFFNSVISRE